MKTTHDFFVPIIPKGQPRPRFARGAKFVRTYDPASAVDWKAQFKAMVAREIGCGSPFPKGVAISMVIEAWFPRPERLKGKDRNGNWKYQAHAMPQASKPDADNLAKIVLDALAPWMYDDAQVSELTIRKWYCDLDGRHTVPGVRVAMTDF